LGWSIFRNHLLFDANLLIYATLYLDELSDDVHNLLSELDNTDEFQAADSFRRQIFLAVDNLRDDEISIPFRVIGTIFGVSKAIIAKQYQRPLTTRQNIGRPMCLDQGSWDVFRWFVVERFTEWHPVTTEDGLLFLSERFGVDLLPNTFRQKVRCDPELRLTKGIPMEKQRVKCDITEIHSSFTSLTENVNGVPSPFVVDLDESGFLDWVDRRERSVIVPSTCRDEKIGIPIDRATKRTSLLCIAADGTWLKPLLILPRKTIQRELLDEGINGRSARFVDQENGFITTSLFTDWWKQVFVSEVRSPRERSQYRGHAVLLMDRLTYHGSDDVEDLSLDNGCFI
jgi:hypothetical protein